MSRRLQLAFAIVASLALSNVARADTWDLNIARLCNIQTEDGRMVRCGSPYDHSVYGRVVQVHPDVNAFRSLMSELGVMFAPNVLQPAETMGYNGFSIGVEMGWVTANPKKNANADDPDLAQRYWRAAGSVSDTAFVDPTLTPEARDRIERELPPSLGTTVSLMARKGFWFPLPSFELGVGVRHLINSSMWAGVVSAKLALHEGYQGLPLPALSVRGSASRVFGTPGFNLTVSALDFALSKAFGVASTFNLTPYLGYQLLWIIADSGVVDATPNRDAAGISVGAASDPLGMTRCNEGVTMDCSSTFAFPDQGNILRHRLFFGMRAHFYVASILLEYSYFTEGSDKYQVVIPNVGQSDAKDESGAQHAVSLALAIEY